MKVLFLNEFLPQEMLGIMWLSRAIKDGGHETKALFIPDKEWLDKIVEYNPDVVCYSVTTGMHLYFLDINKKVKQVLPNTFTIMGGPHATYTPEVLERVRLIKGIGESEHADESFAVFAHWRLVAVCQCRRVSHT